MRGAGVQAGWLFLFVGLAFGGVAGATVALAYSHAFADALDRALFAVAVAGFGAAAWGAAGALLGSVLGRVRAVLRPGLFAVLWAATGGSAALALNAFWLGFEPEAKTWLLSGAVALAGGLACAWLVRRGVRDESQPRAATLIGAIGAAAAVALVATATHALRPPLAHGVLEPLTDAPAPAGRLRLPAGTNVVLILVDTLRADHLSFWGYQRETSPEIDRLARDGVAFTRAIGQATRTSPNMASLLTGLTPLRHGIIEAHTPLADAFLTWPELLAGAGYATASVVANPNMGRRFNFAQGVSFVSEHFQADGEAVVVAALDWLEGHDRSPFFLWLHAVDPHTPYAPPRPYADLFRDDPLYEQQSRLVLTPGRRDQGLAKHARLGTMRALGDYVARYDASIRYVDAWIGRFLAGVSERGHGDDTLFVFTSDHGESLGEHDYYFSHGDHPYEPTAHVPLVFAHPALPRGLVVEDLVRTIDVLPTVLDLVGVPAPGGLEGRSLAPLLAGERLPALEALFIASGTPGYMSLAARTSEWKLALRPQLWWGFDGLAERALRAWSGDLPAWRFRSYRPELYRLTDDPGELVNRSGRGDAVEPWLHDVIVAWADRGREQTEQVGAADLDAEMVEQLRHMGYVE